MTDALLLDPGADPFPELADHPLDLTDDEVQQGLLLGATINTADHTDNGITTRPHLLAATPGYAEALRRAKIVRQCLLEAGTPEVSIELQEGRPAIGDTWNACRPYSAISHHIASAPTPSNPTPGLSLVKRGRPDLEGPLANGTAGVDLIYRILCMGLANHPGFGGPWTVSGPMGAFTIPKDVARPYAWGTEYEGGFSDEVWDREYTNASTGATMTFREFMGRANAGLTRAMWLINGMDKDPGAAGERDLSGYHGEHSTWAPDRKVDRLHYTTESGREEVRIYNDGGDDVSAKDVWDYGIKTLGDAAKVIPARRMLAQAHKWAGDARKGSIAAGRNSEAALRISKATREAVKALAETMPPAEAEKITAALGPDLDEPVYRPEDVPDDDVVDDDETAGEPVES